MISGSNIYHQIWRSKICFMGEKKPITGKWNDEQKKIFNIYYSLYENINGKYDLMAKHIPTRSPCQIRSHWQKYNEKQEREKQKIGKRKLQEDIGFGKRNFKHGYHLIKTISSVEWLKTEECLLKLISFYQLTCHNDVEKQSAIQSKSRMTRRGRTSNQVEQEYILGQKTIPNLLIIAPRLNTGLQKGQQLQKLVKGGEESNTFSNVESYESEDAMNESNSRGFLPKEKKIHKKERKGKK